MLLTIVFALLAHAAQANLSGPSPASGAYVNADGSPLVSLLTNAERSIDIEVYTMNSPTVRQLLRNAIARGVRIRVIKEPNPVGQRCDPFGEGMSKGSSTEDCLDQQRLVKDIRRVGGIFAPFDKTALCESAAEASGKCFEHGKIALVDGVALISSGNFDETSLCLAEDRPKRCNRDYSVVTRDKTVVNTLARLFEADLAGKPYDVAALIPESLRDLFTVSPVSLPPLLKFIRSARVSIDLEAQYLKDPSLNQALEEAAARGIKVTLVTASPCSFGQPRARQVREITDVYSRFDAAGASTRMFTSSVHIKGYPGYMHAKAMVVDGSRAWVGSINGSAESLRHNREYGLIFDEPKDVATVQKQIFADFSDAGTESWRESLDCLRDSLVETK